MLLAHFLWERTARGGQADETGWLEALSDVYLELRDEFDSVWSGLGDGERRTLAAIARGPRNGSRAGARGGDRFPKRVARRGRNFSCESF